MGFAEHFEHNLHHHLKIYLCYIQMLITPQTFINCTYMDEKSNFLEVAGQILSDFAQICT